MRWLTICPEHWSDRTKSMMRMFGRAPVSVSHDLVVRLHLLAQDFFRVEKKLSMTVARLGVKTA